MKVAVLIILLSFLICEAEKIRYIITEHPKVTYCNTNIMRYVNLTSQRYGRDNPFYYVGMHMDWVHEFHNNITVHFVFYEFLSNRYRRGFVEMHWQMCDLVHKDKFFGTAMKQGKLNQPCPFPAGDYHLYNMTIPLTQIPDNFPFTKGRIHCNISATHTKELIASGHINMEIKEKTIRRSKNK